MSKHWTFTAIMETCSQPACHVPCSMCFSSLILLILSTACCSRSSIIVQFYSQLRPGKENYCVEEVGLAPRPLGQAAGPAPGLWAIQSRDQGVIPPLSHLWTPGCLGFSLHYSPVETLSLLGVVSSAVNTHIPWCWVLTRVRDGFPRQQPAMT